jgi:hypothetical protein
MGDGVWRTKTAKVYRRRVKGYQRSNARQPDNDTLSVPPIE